MNTAIKDYHELLNRYGDNSIVKELYRRMSLIYFEILNACFKWLEENKKVGFDFDTQLELYDSKFINEFSCPVVRFLDSRFENNLNFYKHIQSLIRYSEAHNIVSIDNLLYTNTEQQTIRREYTKLGELIYTSVINIVYSRFRVFIQQKNAQQPEGKKNEYKLKVPQIALIYAYEGNQITRDNAKDIAAKYGYNAPNSGEGLYQDYLKYISSNDRKAKPTAETKKTLKNKIKLFESILNHLSISKKQRAIDEINVLKTIYENEYQ